MHLMPCFTGCFGIDSKANVNVKIDVHQEQRACAGGVHSLTGGRRPEGCRCAEQYDCAGLVPLLTGESHGEWWDILQGACRALTMRLPADHASIFMVAGAGVAALATSGVPLFGLQLGKLLLPAATVANTETSDEDSSSSLIRQSELGVCVLAAALQDQTASVPLAFRSVKLKKLEQQQQRRQRQQEDAGHLGATGHSHVAAGYLAKRTCPICHNPLQNKTRQQDGASDDGGLHQRHFVAVGIPGGKSLAGMYILSATGPSAPAAWQAEGLGLVAALLAPLLRPPQVPLVRRTLAELHTACTINDLVHSLSAAAAELVVAVVRVAMQPRVALLRNDGTAAAVFAVSEGSVNSAMCRRRSRDVVLVDAGGSGFSNCKSPDFFMLGQQSFHSPEQDSLGTAVTAAITAPGGGGGGTGGGTGGGILSKSEDDAALQRLRGAPSGVTVPSGSCCRGQSLPLHHTLLAEALTRGSGLCIADCNAYVQDSKAFPRDLMIALRGSGSSAPPQSLALATSCHSGRPLLALYATYHSILPQALLQTVVQELGQLLRALTPTVAALLLPEGPIAEEWSLLHDDLLGPDCVGLTSGHSNKARINSSIVPPSAATTAAAVTAAATAAATTAATAAAIARATVTAATCIPQVKCCTPPMLVSPAPGCRRGGGATAAAAIADTDSCGGGYANGTSTQSPRSSRVDPQPRGPAAGTAQGVVAQIGAFFRRTGTTTESGRQQNDTPGALPNIARCATAPGGGHVTSPGDAVLTAMTAAAAALTGGTNVPVGTDAVAAAAAAATDGVEGRSDNTTTASQRLVAFVSGVSGVDAAADVGSAGPRPGGISLRSGTSRKALAHCRTGRTSFSLEVVGSPRGGVRLAPLITTLHDRLKSAQAEQLTASSRAASRIQDLGSLRFLERVGKGGYGSVYRGLYHGSEVAIKVVEDPSLGNTAAAAAARPLTSAASVTLLSKHIHDAIELVASVSMSHPNIVQLITYFVDVRAQHCQHRDRKAATPCARSKGNNPATDTADGGGAATSGSELLHLVRMTSSGMDSNTSSLTDPGGNEAIVLVMEYCDRGSLKEAIQDGSFLQKETLTHVISLHKHQQQGGQQQQQQQQHVQQMAALARGGMGLINMKAVYSTLLEVALALRHMHGLHMVHCDLKPQNVLLKSSPRDPRGFTAKLSDFGLAKMMAHDEEGQLVIDDAIQSGTLTHLPPEALIGGRQLGPTVDIYAFGIVMFQMLCGMTVYRGLDLKQIIRGVVLQGLRPTVPAWVPQGYRDLAQRCWHDRPSCRPTSLQLVSELEALLEACDGQQGTLNRHGFASTGGSVGSIRLGTGGCVSDPAKHHRLPHRCATDTAIQGRRLPQTAATGSPMPRTIVVATENAVVIAAGSSGGGGGGDAVTNNVALLPPQLPAALFRHPPVDVYHPPQSLYQPHSTGAGSQPPTEGPGVVSVVDLGLRPGTVPSSVHPGGVGGRMAAFHPAPLPLPAAAVALLNQTSLYTLTLPAATSPPAPPASPQPTPHPMLLTP